MYYSYVMGIDDSILELKNQGFVIENDNENYTISFPKDKAMLWEEFIVNKLELGYWNEYLADDKVVFLFQLEEGIERYEVFDFKNDEVLALCEKLCECKMESLEKMLSENWYYKKVMADRIKSTNQTYWNEHADLWFGTTALPTLGVLFPTEEELHLFGDVTGKRMLEICCGSGHSLKYNADRGATELWGIDISQKQLENASAYLNENGYSANLICSPMEADMDIPKEYFDIVYSIYGVGWTTDLQGTFDKIASYLKKDGIFIFSWHHTLNYCVGWSCDERKDVLESDGSLIFHKSYFDESYFNMPVHDSKIVLCNRKISTYINALANAGFVIEQMIEQTDDATMAAEGNITDKEKKAKMVPISFCIKARKL